MLQDSRLPYVGKHLWGCWNRPELMLQVAFVKKAKVFVHEAEEAIDVFVFGEGLSHVVHLSAVVLAAWVVNKQGSRDRSRARSKINKASVRSAPDGMKLSLDEHLGTLPYGPP